VLHTQHYRQTDDIMMPIADHQRKTLCRLMFIGTVLFADREASRQSARRSVLSSTSRTWLAVDSSDAIIYSFNVGWLACKTWT